MAKRVIRNTTRLLAAAAIFMPLTATAVPTATNLDGSFSLSANTDIFDSTTVPHTTVTGFLTDINSVAWYSFTGTAGRTVYFDHDDETSGTLIDSVFSLFRSSGELIGFDDDSSSDGGSSTGQNAFLGVLALPADDTYYLAVTSFGHAPDTSGCSFSSLLTRPDGQFGGNALTGCTDRDFSFNGIGTSNGRFTVHVSYAQAATVPEPATLALVGLGLAGLAGRRRRA